MPSGKASWPPSRTNSSGAIGKKKKFTQCGDVVEQTNEGFELSQPTYLENLHEINICASRKKDRSQATSDKEKSQLRALLGGISWHAQQVAPYLAADVSLLLTEVSRSTIETVVKANILLNTAKSRQKQKMKIHAFREEDDLTMVMWVDAANANRADGGSTQGLFPGNDYYGHAPRRSHPRLSDLMALPEDRPHVSLPRGQQKPKLL